MKHCKNKYSLGRELLCFSYNTIVGGRHLTKERELAKALCIELSILIDLSSKLNKWMNKRKKSKTVIITKNNFDTYYKHLRREKW